MLDRLRKLWSLLNRTYVWTWNKQAGWKYHGYKSAAGVAPSQELSSEPAGWRWKYGDTDHHKWVVADFPPPPGVKVFRLEPLYAAGVAPTRGGEHG